MQVSIVIKLLRSNNKLKIIKKNQPFKKSLLLVTKIKNNQAIKKLNNIKKYCMKRKFHN